jgi:3-hydroxyacyl-[acyl-carrier-protein] dehydratase
MRWMWIDQIVAYEHGRHLAAVKNVSLAEEHLHDHFDAASGPLPLPVMPASLMIEGMAQTAGILVGAAHKFREKVILAKINRARIDADAGPGHTLRYEATIERLDATGASTTGVIRRLDHGRFDGGWQTIGAIDLMFSHIDQNRSGLAFPEHNFVFGEAFKLILRNAAVGDLMQVIERA